MRTLGVIICGKFLVSEGLVLPSLTLRRQVRDELNHEALQFVKEQRIRCLLQGAWFPHSMSYSSDAGPITSKSLSRSVPSAWRFVRLSHNRRYLHYADFDEKTATEPRLDALQEKSTCSGEDASRSWLLSSG
jgi:engulfment/cell motility protein 1